MGNFIVKFIMEATPVVAAISGLIAVITYIIQGQNNPINFVVLLLTGILFILMYISEQLEKLIEKQEKLPRK